MVKTQKMARRRKESQDGEDISVLRTPIQLNGKPVEQILNSIHYGTPELRDLLLDECDIIFECKVCRALFRDLANFLAHKRRYCSKSVFEDNHYAIAKIPDEKVYVIQPQAPESSSPNICPTKQRSKPSLEETVARIQSGDLGHSQAFKVYTDAANKLKRQKEEMKVATIRTRAIPTNSNAVFMDVNMASVNIHERPAASACNPAVFKPSAHSTSSIMRKAREGRHPHKNNSPSKKVSSRILRKDCKNSEELQKLLMNELKEIQNKVKQKTQVNDPVKRASAKKEQPKVKINNFEKDMPPPSSKRVTSFETDGQSSKSSDNGNKIQSITKPSSVKAETVENGDEPMSNGSNTASPKKKCGMLVGSFSQIQESSKVCQTSNITRSLRRKSLICHKCHRIFSTKRTLAFHYQIIHSSKKTFFPCLYCPSVFYYFQGVTRHLRMNHFKSKSEINSIRNELRAKAYTKVLPEVKEQDTRERSMGARKSLRHKQEAFSSKISSNSSYVLHSVKKQGKQLSAKKDALITPEAKEQVKELDTDVEKSKDLNDSGTPLTNVKTPTVKQEAGTSSMISLSSSSLQKVKITESNRRHKTSENRLKSSLVSPKSFPSKTCKKCRRVFGRTLTYKNHIKICQGKVTALSHGSRGRSRKKFTDQKGFDGLAVSTRSRKVWKNQPPVMSDDEFDLIPVKRINSSHKANPSPSRDTTKSLCVNRHEDTVSESSNSRERGTKTVRENESSKLRSSSVPASRSCDMNSVIKPEEADFKIAQRQLSNDQNTRTKTEKKETLDSSQDNEKLKVHQPEKYEHRIDVSVSADSNTQLKTRTASQRIVTKKPDFVAISSQMDKETDRSVANEDVEKNGKKVSTNVRNLRGAKESASPDPGNLIKSVLPCVNKERRSNSSEKDMRHKISHLVPRSCRDSFVALNKDMTNSASVPSTSPSGERPRRKRKVPTRNIEAMEMLSKIHNPDKGSSPCKKLMLSQERDLNATKSTRGRSASAIESKQSGDAKCQSLEEKDESDPREDWSQFEDMEIKDSRPTKGRSRMFVLGRKKPRGRKLLRSYDNARVDKLIDIHNSKCLVCGEQYTQLYNLRRHIIRIHLQWSRYQCKLCRFASFDRSECTTHIVRNHKKVVNIEDAQAVNCFITDLAKLGSQAMNKKKNQTLRDKNKQVNNEANIYARPNVKKMPRLAERTMVHDRGGTGTDSLDTLTYTTPRDKQKQTSDDAKSTDTNLNLKAVRPSAKGDTGSHDASDNLSRKNSLPFNISTRNSPRVFDIRPYKSNETSNTQGEVVVLHTRKGMYTKTVPALTSKEKSDSDAKEVAMKKDDKVNVKKEDLVETKDDNACITEKTLLQTNRESEVDPPKHFKQRNIFDKLGLPDIDLHVEKKNLSNENKFKVSSIEPCQSQDEDIHVQGEMKGKAVSEPCEENMTKTIESDIALNKDVFPQKCLQSLSNGPSSTITDGTEANELKKCDIGIGASLIKLSDSTQEIGPQVSTLNLKSSLSPPVATDLSSPKTIKISPSFVVINSSRLPSEIRAGASSCTVALNFSHTPHHTAEDLKVADDKATLLDLDKICDEETLIPSSTVSVSSSSSESEQTSNNSNTKKAHD